MRELMRDGPAVESIFPDMENEDMLDDELDLMMDTEPVRPRPPRSDNWKYLRVFETGALKGSGGG